jgi:lysozyme
VVPYLVKDEGFVADAQGNSKPYYDAVGVLTDCFGNSGQGPYKVRLSLHRTKAECRTILAEEIERSYYGPLVARIPGFGSFPIPTQIATTRFAYNVGVEATVKGSVGQLFARGRLVEGCKAMLMYDKGTINGKKVRIKGLTTRRQAEAKQCLEGAAQHD